MTEDQADELVAQLKAINESLGRIAAAIEKPLLTVEIPVYWQSTPTALPDGSVEVVSNHLRAALGGLSGR